MSERDKVKAFHALMGIPTQERPSMPDEVTRLLRCRLLRCRLLLEETLEYIAASGFEVVAYNPVLDVRTLNIRPNPHLRPDLAAMAQESADVRYIAHGNDLAMGVDGRPFNEVHRANMAKAPNGVVRKDERGKVLKPEGWKPPDVARVLEEWDLDYDPWERDS